MLRSCLRITMIRALLAALSVVLCAPAPARAQAITVTPHPAGDVTLFRVFLKDGSSVVSYGEYARIGGGDAVFSMPVGGPPHAPRLQLVTLPAATIDWARTERYAVSARYQRYLSTRAEDDYAQLSIDVAATLNEIALTTDPARALALAFEARRMLADWPASHYGYRENDVRDLVAFIDDVISGLRPGTRPGSAYQFSLVAMRPPVPVEPLLGMPAPREQVERLTTLAALLPSAPDRMNLLLAALALVEDPSAALQPDEAVEMRRRIEARLDEERETERLYTRLTERLMTAASGAASRAAVPAVEQALLDMEREDVRLGRRRPETIRSLRAALLAELDAARDLRQRRDQWRMRRGMYRAYVERVSVQVAQLERAKGELRAIRDLAGPPPARMRTLRNRLLNGTERLSAVTAPEQLRSTHELLIAAWALAERGVESRHAFIDSGDLEIARQASAAAAGSLMLLERAQAEMRAALQPPVRR
jgi:hypothetical protein